MNWKIEAIDKLKAYEEMQAAVKNLTDTIELLDTQRHEDSESLDLMTQYNESIRALQNARVWVNNIQRALKALTPNERLVLQRLYIKPEKKAVLKLTEELDYEASSIYRIREKALTRFTRALYGCLDQL